MPDEEYNLLVKISPEGADETNRELREVSETFEETADSAQEDADRLEGFARQWRGAMAVIVAGLGVASAGLLSKVPVIQDSLLGLSAVMESVGLSIDEVLRPGLSDFNDALFDLAIAIDEADSSTRAFVGILGTLIAVVPPLAGAIAYLVSPLAGLATAAFAVGTAAAVVTAELSGLTDMTGIVEADTDSLIGVITDLLVIIQGPYIFALMNLQDALDGTFTFDEYVDNVQQFVGRVLESLTNLPLRGARLIARFVDAVADLLGVELPTVTKVAESSIDELRDMIADEWNEQIRAIDDALGGIRAVMNRFVGRVRQGFRGAVNAATDLGGEMFSGFFDAFGGIGRYVRNVIDGMIEDVQRGLGWIGDLWDSLTKPDERDRRDGGGNRNRNRNRRRGRGGRGGSGRRPRDREPGGRTPVRRGGGGIVLGTGGIVTDAVDAVVGEAGPEAVIPLDGRGVKFMSDAIAQAMGGDDGPRNPYAGRSTLRVDIHPRWLAEALSVELQDGTVNSGRGGNF